MKKLKDNKIKKKIYLIKFFFFFKKKTKSNDTLIPPSPRITS